MWGRRGKNEGKKTSLAEEISSLVDPRPSNYDGDEEEDEDATKICEEYLEAEEEEREDTGSHLIGAKRKTRPLYQELEEEDDPKYGGRSISREEIKAFQDDTLTTSDSCISSEEEEREDTEEEEEGGIEEDIESDKNEDIYYDEEEKDEEEDDRERVMADPHDDISILPVTNKASIDNDDVEKGKAVKHQLALWDGLLEGRIKLQKCLSLSNQLPQNETAKEFAQSGSLALGSVYKCEEALNSLMKNLLQLQKSLQEKTLHTIGDGEEEEEEEGKGVNDFEDIIDQRHKRFRCYRDETLEKWSTRLQLASGKLTMKSYSYQRRQSILKNIEFALQDQTKLRKRTQLNRAQQLVLGKRRSSEREEEGGVKEEVKGTNAHLNDFDKEIFNDEDFYHQLLRELIQSKTSFTDKDNDQIAMGRKWLELQSLRAKVKKKATDTKASKGRKLRYHAHQKLVGFMAPINSCNYSESARYNLFSSVFDSRKGSSNYLDTTNH